MSILTPALSAESHSWCCKARKLQKFEVPTKVVLIDELWTPDNDMLTAVQKLKRKEIVARHKAQIDAVYV